MNKYVLRTSLVWMAVLAVLAAIWAYQSHWKKQPQVMKTDMPMSGDVRPVAAGPASDMEKYERRSENRPHRAALAA